MAQEYLGLERIHFNKWTHDGMHMCLTCGAVVPRMFDSPGDGLALHDSWHENKSKEKVA